MMELPVAAGTPLWSLGLLRCADSREWAVLFRTHHSAYDGAGMGRALQRLLAPASLAEHVAGKTDGRPRAPLSRTVRGLASLGLELLHDRAPRVHALQAPLEEPCRVAWAHCPARTMQDIACKHQVTGNVVFLAALSLALRQHLQATGCLVPESVIATVPLSLPAGIPRAPVGNSISCTRLRLPLHLADPRACLQHVHESSLRSRKMRHREGGRGADRLGQALPARWTRILLDGGAHLRWSNLIATNLGELDTPLFCGEGRVQAIVALTIRPPGGGLTASLASHGGTVTAGFTLCHRVDPCLDLPRYYSQAVDGLLR